MTLLLSAFMLVASAPLHAKDIFFASEKRLEQVVGPRTSPPREPGIRFAHPGYHEVWVDGAGRGMKHVRLGLASLIPWKQFLARLELNGSHATATSVALPPSPIPLFRNKLTLHGVTGQPLSQGKPWNVTFVEYAVADTGKMRQMRDRIFSLPVGPQRNELIKTCYDWWSEIDLTSS